ncbi:hypothetical protein MKW92_034716 [Papaver armeniacum]|nr:hypothetical protein MKW92_034716 [Papaver armeniacum]
MSKQRQSKISFGGSKQPVDPTWEHCKVVTGGKKTVLTCNYCGNKYSGGVYRMKQHLAQTKKDAAMCKEVPPEFENDKEKCEELGDLNGEDELGTREKLMRNALDGTKTPKTLSTYFKKPKREDACMSICDFFYANALPFNLVNNKYFNRMLHMVGEFGKGLKPPSMHEVRVTNLQKKVKYVHGTLEAFKQERKRTGCTLMSDGWTDKKHRSITNFLVNSPSENLFALLDGIVEEVGEENVVQVITDGALAYVKADIGDLPMHLDTVEKAKFVSSYIYKRSLVLNLMREHTNGRDLIRVGATRFATNYLNLKSFHVFKVALREMFTSDAWKKSKHAKEQQGIKVQKIILSDENFWQSVISCLKSVIPIVKVLTLVDGDDKPEMGYIYKAIDKAKEQIQANFKNKKRRYESYINIIDLRWNTQLHGPLHAAGYFLNPRYQYATDFAPNVDVKLGFYDAIKKMCPLVVERHKIDKQIDLFTSVGGMFGHEMARETKDRKHPALWWKSYGDSAPELQRVAIRVLSATCSASGCERNWSIFEQVHTKRRNRLSQQRLNALVYVKYNLQLEETFTKRNEQGDSYDPICLSDMESDDEWITEKDGASLQPDPTWMDVHDSRLVEENEIDEVEEDEIEEETCVEEMSETEIQAESDNEWLSDDGFDMGDH